VVVARGAALAWGVEARWFLGRDACDLHTTSGAVAMDPAGIAHPEPADRIDEIAYASCDAPPPPKPPQAEDLQMTRELGKTIRPLASEWTAGATTDQEKLAAIEGHLLRYEYSLKVD